MKSMNTNDLLVNELMTDEVTEINGGGLSDAIEGLVEEALSQAIPYL